MTVGAFLEYVLAHDCHIYQQTKTYLKLRKNGTKGTGNMSGLPFENPKKEILPFTACLICQNLGIDSPEDVEAGKGPLEFINKNHFSKEE